MLKKEEKEIRNQIINNFIYYSKKEVNEILAITLLCLILALFNMYLITIHIILLFYYSHRISNKSLLWYKKNRLNKLKLRYKKPYQELSKEEKKEIQKMYHFSGKYNLGINILTGTTFLYALVFYFNNIINLCSLLIVLILYNVYLFFDLKRLIDWYKSMI